MKPAADPIGNGKASVKDRSGRHGANPAPRRRRLHSRLTNHDASDPLYPPLSRLRLPVTSERQSRSRAVYQWCV